MTDRPILFSAPMVRALLDGTKTQTRRVLKFAGRAPEFCGGAGDKDDPTCWGWEDSEHGDWVTLERDADQRMGWRDWRGAYQIGDRLWVRENWFVDHMDCMKGPYRAPEGMTHDELVEQAYLHFGATDDPNSWEAEQPKWRPSIHMPRWASRLTMTVTDVRVQRLKDISEDDARAEGCRAIGAEDCPDEDMRSYIWAFSELWDSINGPDAWCANPWVVAVSFTVHQCNIDQLHQQTEAA